MEYLLLVLATVFSSMKAILGKRVGQDGSNLSGVLFLNFNIFFVAALTVFTFFVGQINTFFEISSYSLILSVLFALFLLFTYVTQMRALNTGAASLGTLIYSCGFLVPIFYSALFLDESITLYQLIGILLLAISFGFIIPPKKGESFSLKWLMFAVLSMLGSGSVAVVQKIHQSSPYKDELPAFLFFALLFASVFLLVGALAVKRGPRRELLSTYKVRSTVLFTAMAGVVVGGLNVVNLKLSGQLPAVIHFPVYNGCSMILTALAGRFLFKERIGKTKLFGFVLGIVSIIIVGLF